MSEAAKARLEVAAEFGRQKFIAGIGFTDMADVAGFSSFHFHRLFTKHFGKTPKEFLTELQIGEAMKRLLAGETFVDVAIATGFAHQSHFCTRFKQITGRTPRGWLKAKRNKDKS